MNTHAENLWAAMDSLRAIDYTRYMNEILTLTFVRYLEAKENRSYCPDINPDKDINKELKTMFEKIEEDNPNLNGLFSQIQLLELTSEEFNVIRYSINQLNINEGNSSDIFNMLLSSLIEASGRYGSIYNTPNSINDLFAEILDVEKGDIYDGTVGSGQLLIQIGKKAKGEQGSVKLWGQDINSASAAIARINMIINNFTHEIAVGNSLSDPKFTENNKLNTFDYVVMDFPISVDWRGIDKDLIQYDKYGRFPYGIPPKTKADMLFVQHAVSSLNPNGKAALLTGQGILFWGGSNQKIRQKLIDSDFIEAVILLPGNLLQRTAIPTSILIFNKNKKQNRKGKIQIINAEEIINSTRTRRGRSVELDSKEIQRIKEIYSNFSEEKNISIILDNEDIEDANLTFLNYSQFVEVESILGIIEVNKKHFERNFQDRVNLADLGELYRGIAPTTKISDSNEECYIIQPSDIKNSELQVSELKKISLDSTQSKEYLVNEGDIVLTSRGKSIKVATIPKTDKKIVLSQNMIGFRPEVDKIDSDFLQMYLTSPIGMAYLSTNQSSATTTTLNRRDLETIPVPIMDRSDQRLIGEMKKRSDQKLRKSIKEAENAYKEKQKELYSQIRFDEAFEIIN